MNNPFLTIDERLSNIEGLLLDIKHSKVHEPNDNVRTLLSVGELAEKLNISKPTLYTKHSKGEIPTGFKAPNSKKLMWHKDQIDAWIESGSKDAVDAGSFLKQKQR